MASLAMGPPVPLMHWPDWVYGVIVAVAVLSLASVVAVALRVRAGSVRSRRDWKVLEQLAPELVGQADESAILRVALADAPRMFACSRVEVRLHPAAHRPALVASAEAGTDEPVDVHATAQLEATPSDRESFPLYGADGHIGLLILDRARGGGGGRERLAGAFAHMLASSLAAARALGEERRLVEETEQRATQDDLTGLGNRWLLEQWGDHLLTVSRSQGRTSAVLLLDADDFKRINDTLGHDGGDRVLAEMGRRIRGSVRDTDLAVRLGGDEFALLTGDLGGPGDAERLAERLLERLAVPMVVEDVELITQASVGVAVNGEDGDTLDELLRSADQAMYEAKASGPGQWRRAARGSERRPRTDRERIAADLRQGLPAEQVVLHYQPQVDARTGEIRGFEALARWQHPELGLLAPADFVPTAERAGLMRHLTAVVLDRALGDRAALDRAVPGARVSVNVSARNLLHHGLVGRVAHYLDAHDTPRGRLTLEVAEPSVGTDSSVGEVFAQLADLGCRISVSEYGTGQSSLTALAHLPGIAEIKVNPGLVSRLASEAANRRLVTAITTAAHSLHVVVVAEGVETLDMVHELRGIGCDVLQGFHIAAPASLDEVLGWVTSWPVQRVGRL